MIVVLTTGISALATSFPGQTPSKPAGFIADLDLSSIGEDAIKAAYPTEHEAIIGGLKGGEWRRVRMFYRLISWCAS